MDKSNFDEYRCSCGKLLFKAFIILSVVEIKCKRCAKVTSFGEINPIKGSFSFLISIDKDGIIRDLCKGAEMVLGYSKNSLIGTPIAKICPLVHDKILKENKKSSLHSLKDNTFTLHDGLLVPTETFVVPGPDSKSGYYIFSKHKPLKTSSFEV